MFFSRFLPIHQQQKRLLNKTDDQGMLNYLKTELPKAHEPVTNVELELVNMEGKLLRSIKSGSSKQVQINIEGLSSGFYNLIIRMHDKEDVIVKIIKK